MGTDKVRPDALFLGCGGLQVFVIGRLYVHYYNIKNL